MPGSKTNARITGVLFILGTATGIVAFGSPDPSFFQPLGAVLRTASDWMGNGFYLFPWCIAAFLYYSVFWKTKVVPRWLSLWGSLGLFLMLVSSFWTMFGALDTLSPVQGLMNSPLALQEMGLAVWLLVKGYHE